MIPRLRLAKSGITTSRLGFGTSWLHHVDGDRRQRILAAAADVGIVHFDTAPAYGDGLAEEELGRFLKGRRDGIVLATKYGIPADPLVAALPALAAPLRVVRALARRAGLWRQSPPALTAAGLRASVEASLRRLGVETIDILFLHEPTLTRVPSPADLVAEMQRLRERGLIRSGGLAGGWRAMASLATAAPALTQVVQTAEAEWPESAVPDITYAALAADPQSGFAARLPAELAAERLMRALRRRPNGVVLVSTTSVEHLRELGAIAAREPTCSAT